MYGVQLAPPSAIKKKDKLQRLIPTLNNVYAFPRIENRNKAALARFLWQAMEALNKAVPPPSVASSADGCTKALHSLLSPPTLSRPPPPHLNMPPSAPHLQRKASMRSAGTGTLHGSVDGGSAVTYRSFLERLTRADSKGFVNAIRLFLYSIFGTSGDAPAFAKLRSGDLALRREADDVEVYGSSFLFERYEILGGGSCGWRSWYERDLDLASVGSRATFRPMLQSC